MSDLGESVPGEVPGRAETVWNGVLGPFYSELGLRRRGVRDATGLVGLTCADGAIVYPHAQFDLLPDQTLRPRKAVLELWNTLILPAIDAGIVDEWTATGLGHLLQTTENNRPSADLISHDPTQVGKVAVSIRRTLSSLGQ